MNSSSRDSRVTARSVRPQSEWLGSMAIAGIYAYFILVWVELRPLLHWLHVVVLLLLVAVLAGVALLAESRYRWKTLGRMRSRMPFTTGIFSTSSLGHRYSGLYLFIMVSVVFVCFSWFYFLTDQTEKSRELRAYPASVFVAVSAGAAIGGLFRPRGHRERVKIEMEPRVLAAGTDHHLQWRAWSTRGRQLYWLRLSLLCVAGRDPHPKRMGCTIIHSSNLVDEHLPGERGAQSFYLPIELLPTSSGQNLAIAWHLRVQATFARGVTIDESFPLELHPPGSLPTSVSPDTMAVGALGSTRQIVPRSG